MNFRLALEFPRHEKLALFHAQLTDEKLQHSVYPFRHGISVLLFKCEMCRAERTWHGHDPTITNSAECPSYSKMLLKRSESYSEKRSHHETGGKYNARWCVNNKITTFVCSSCPHAGLHFADSKGVFSSYFT
jgi:hypothetical protein